MFITINAPIKTKFEEVTWREWFKASKGMKDNTFGSIDNNMLLNIEYITTYV